MTPLPASPPPVLVILAVDDVARASGFYAGVFGWGVAVDATPTYVELDASPGFRLGLYQRGGFARNLGSVPLAVPVTGTTATELYLRVGDPVAALARVLAHGGRLVSSPAVRPWGEVVGYGLDLDGNVVAVAAPAAPDAGS